jgi:7-dehydrocholesterol reductase
MQSVYVSHSLYLVNHSIDLNIMYALPMFLLGYACVWINYDTDRQRAEVRSTNGNCLIWGEKAKTITAHYVTEKGEKKTSLLLYSGWWGVSRHFHYVPEILASLFWSMPGGFNHIMPYFYVIFLTFLLADRAFRDDSRCAAKYGADWVSYCKKVPYKIIPFLV